MNAFKRSSELQVVYFSIERWGTFGVVDTIIISRHTERSEVSVHLPQWSYQIPHAVMNDGVDSSDSSLRIGMTGVEVQSTDIMVER